MILDICLGILLVVSIVLGYRKGFTESFLHTIGWLLAVVLGFVWTPTVADFLRANTAIEENLRGTLTERLANLSVDFGTNLSLPFSADGILQGIPQILSDYFEDAISVIGTNTVNNLVDIIFSIIAFLLIIVLIKLIFFFIIFLFSKKKRKGIIGFSDGMLGAVFGAIKGAFLLCLLLAFFLPISNLIESDVLLEQLYSSTYAIRVYDNNPIFFLTQLFF